MPPKNKARNKKIQQAILNLQNNLVRKVQIVSDGDDGYYDHDENLHLFLDSDAIDIDTTKQSAKDFLDALKNNDSIREFVFESMTEKEQILLSDFFHNKVIEKLKLEEIKVSTAFMEQICERLRYSKEVLQSITIVNSDIEIELLRQFLSLTKFSVIENLDISFARRQRWKIYKTLIKILPNYPQLKRLVLWNHDEVEPKMLKGFKEIIDKMTESIMRTPHLVDYQDDFLKEKFPDLKQLIDKKSRDRKQAEQKLENEFDILHSRVTKESIKPESIVVNKTHRKISFDNKNLLTKFTLRDTLKELSSPDSFAILEFEDLSNIMLTEKKDFNAVFSNETVTFIKIEGNDMSGSKEQEISNSVITPILNNLSVNTLSLYNFDGKYLGSHFANHINIHLVDLSLESCEINNNQALQILKNCFHLHHLNLTNNYLNGAQKHFSEVVLAIVQNPIGELILDENAGLGVKGLTILLQLLEFNVTLKVLSLQHCDMEDSDFNCLIASTAKLSLLLKKIFLKESFSFSPLVVKRAFIKLQELSKNKPIPGIMIDEDSINFDESDSEEDNSIEIKKLVGDFSRFFKNSSNPNKHKAFFIELLNKQIEKIVFIDTHYLTYLLQNVFHNAMEQEGKDKEDEVIIREVFKAYQALDLNIADYEKKLLKYLGHSYKLKDAKVVLKDATLIKLEGWKADDFLDVLIMSLFYTLVLLVAKKIRLPYLPKEQVPEMLEQQLLNELAYACNTRILRKFLVDIHGCDETANSHALFKKLADSLLSKLSAMADNTSICIPTGYTGHAIYVHLLKIPADIVAIRIDNCGNFSRQNHVNRSGEILPRILSEFKLTNAHHKKLLKKYIVHLCECKILTNKEFKEQRSIYGFPNLPKPTHDYSLPSRSIQITGNCVFESYDIGTEIRINNPEIYSWLKNQLIITMHELKPFFEHKNPLQSKIKPIAPSVKSNK